MAKGRKSKGKRRGGKRKSKKGRGHKAAKHSLALEGAGAWDGYKVITADMSGQTVGQRMLGAITDQAQRNALKSPGAMKNIIIANTKELQMVALVKVGQRLPLVKGPINMVANALNSLGRQFGIKGKYKVI